MLPIRSTRLNIQHNDLNIALEYRRQFLGQEQKEEVVESPQIISPDTRRQNMRDRIGFTEKK